MNPKILRCFMACNVASLTKAWILDTVVTNIHLDTFSYEHALSFLGKDETATQNDIDMLTKLIMMHIESYARSDEMVQYYNELMC